MDIAAADPTSSTLPLVGHPSSDTEIRDRFLDECKRFGCAVFEKTRYDEIVSVLQGVADKTVIRKHRNNRLRYSLVDSDGSVALINNDMESLDRRRVVHSMELFDVIINAYGSLQSPSVDKLYRELRKHYTNISREICSVFLQFYERSYPSKVVNEGFFSLVDMKRYPDNQLRWIIVYQALPSNNVYARAVRLASARTVAEELFKIFIDDGPPEHLFSNTKMKFIRKTLHHILSMSPTLEIIIKRSHNYEYLTEKFEDFQRSLEEWKDGKWSIGIYYCAALLSNKSNEAIESLSLLQGSLRAAAGDSGQDDERSISTCEVSEGHPNPEENFDSATCDMVMSGCGIR